MGAAAHRLPGKEDDIGVTTKDNERFVDAVLYRYWAGIPWRDLPEWFDHPHRDRSWSVV